MMHGNTNIKLKNPNRPPLNLTAVVSFSSPAYFLTVKKFV